MKGAAPACRLLVVALMLIPSAAAAGDGFVRGLSLTAGTDFPVSVGARATVQLPFGIEAAAGAGVMPGPYVSLINGTLVKFNAYNQETADLIEASLKNSLVVSLEAGWDPGDPGGFFLDAGYLLATLGGAVSSVTLIQEATGKDLSWMKSVPEIPVATTLHSLTLRAGWRLVLVDHLELAFALGVLKTIASSTTVDLGGGASGRGAGAAALQSKIAQAQSEIDAYMNDIYVSYVAAPFVTVNAGYRFW